MHNKMDRRLVLRMLLEKSDQAQDFLKDKFSVVDLAGAIPQSGITFKRMQILQMGKCKIKPPKPQFQPPRPKIIQAPSIHKNKSFTVSLQKKSPTDSLLQSSRRGFSASSVRTEEGPPGKRVIVNRIDNHTYEDKTQQEYQKMTQNFMEEGGKQEESNIKFNHQSCTSNLSHSDNQICKQRSGPHTNRSQLNSVTASQGIGIMSNSRRPINMMGSVHSEQISNGNTSKKSVSRFGSLNKNRRSACNFDNRKEQHSLIPSPHSAGLPRRTFHTNSQQQNRLRLMNRRQINKCYAKPFVQPPKITANSYIITEIGRTDGFKIHYAFQSKNVVQIASLTKIMTCIVAVEFGQNNGLDMTKQEVPISNFEANVGGTSAKISKGQIYTLQQLLFGLMLPSGNDASLAIAVCIGRKLLSLDFSRQDLTSNDTKMKYFESKQNSDQLYNKKSESVMSWTKRQCYNRFINEMNNKAKQLGMTKTLYANSHGLCNIMNKSCCHDLSLLCQYSMRNKKFAQIVSTRLYQTTIRVSEHSQPREKKCKSKLKPKKRYLYRENQDSEDESDQDYQAYEDLTEQTSSTVVNIHEPQSFELANRTVIWQNTHKLLQHRPKQYIGIKTGVTKAAGPCLSSCIVSPNGRMFIIIVLDCKKMAGRFKQTDILKKWLYKKEAISFYKKNQKQETPKTLDFKEQYIDLIDYPKSESNIPHELE